jgi:hypothetical protein
LDGVIGRRGIAIQLPPSILAKLIILKPIEHGHHWPFPLEGLAAMLVKVSGVGKGCQDLKPHLRRN